MRTGPRPSTLFLGVNGLLLAGLLGLALIGRPGARAGQAERVRLAAELRVTDLCLFTEARYTRHPAMADLHSAFQDHPASLEHFPSGALVRPPTPPASPHALRPGRPPQHP